ncbi:LAMI_0E10528g1_1 [Lachancea mirantina]|uniref:protein-tyrosine-phosphatase n=1 Tax=Lachancea mirantina TaxID=1230905 RepID=A0A1G4JP64_9SACH|nr:LAMI_0E10528g1_1 [Lachancea mirantina]
MCGTSHPLTCSTASPVRQGSGHVIHRRATSALGTGGSAAWSPVEDVGQRPAFKAGALETRAQAPGFLLRSNSIPSLPTLRTKETRLPKPIGCELVSGAALAQKVSTTRASTLLVVDIRPFVDYSRGTIRGSLHVSLPSTLMRRKTFTLERLIGNLPDHVRAGVSRTLLERDDCSDVEVVIFDNTSHQTAGAISAACHGMASKFLQCERWAAVRPPRVAVLECGFVQFRELAAGQDLGESLVEEPAVVANSPSPTGSQGSQGRSAQLSDSDLVSPFSSSPLARPRMNSIFRSTSCIAEPPSMPSSFCESPVSSCSPVSTLFKFQLPSASECPPNFKLPQSEEINKLEDYISAVNICEYKDKDNVSTPFPSTQLHAFQFPPSGPPNTSKTEDKLAFQRKYDSICASADKGGDAFKDAVPRWFKLLVNASKVDLIAQYQKIDLLEKRRLSQCLSKNKATTFEFCPSHLENDSSGSEFSFQKRTESCPSEWLDYYDSDEEDKIVRVSSGVELGSKNRYKDIFPFEHSRVILKKKDTRHDDICDNYINANYLVNPFARLQAPSGQDHPNVRYIATQAPLASTTHDFYTCIINNGVPLILSLTDEFENGIEKCFRFWAEGNYDGIHVKMLEETGLPPTSSKEKGDDGNVIIRRIQLTYDVGESYEVMQIQVKNWPDFGTLVEPHEILRVINLKNFAIGELYRAGAYDSHESPTILVHCSAGCGRTGTFCALDSTLSNMSKLDSLEAAWSERKNDKQKAFFITSPKSACLNAKVFDPVSITINSFRKQRIAMVQNVNQYLFIFDCLLAYFRLKLGMATSSGTDSWKLMTEENRQLDTVRHFLDSKIE